ncbi:hypothetical protein GCM10020331_041230 [Ectobacillus funiculus]
MYIDISHVPSLLHEKKEAETVKQAAEALVETASLEKLVTEFEGRIITEYLDKLGGAIRQKNGKSIGHLS